MFLKVSCILLIGLASLVKAEAAWSWLNRDLGELKARRGVIEQRLAVLPAFPVPQVHERAGFHSSFAPAVDSLRWVQVDLGSAMPLDEVFVIPAVLGGMEAYGFPKRFRIDASNDALFAESVTLLDHTHEDAVPRLAPWRAEARGTEARYLRFSATRLVPQRAEDSMFIFALGELLAFSGGRNVALQGTVNASNAKETLPTWSPRHLVDGTHGLGLPVRPGIPNTNGWHGAISSRPDAEQWVEVDFGELRPMDEIRLIPAHPSDFPDRFGFGFPRRFKVEADEMVVFDGTTADFANPGDTPVAFPTAGLQARKIRVTATRLWERNADYVFALAELQAFHAGENIAPGATVTSLNAEIIGMWNHENLLDGLTSNGALRPEAEWLGELSERRQLVGELKQVAALEESAMEIARQRAWWLAAVVALVGIGAGWLLIWRAKRNRHRDMQSLRQRISRDLHDEIGSNLSSIGILSQLGLDSAQDPAAMREELEEIRRVAASTAASMHDIVWLISPGQKSLGDLIARLRETAACMLVGIGYSFETEAPDHADAASGLPLETQRELFLIFKEALHNIRRHAAATAVNLNLTLAAGVLTLVIRDNGRGFDQASPTTGFGLSNMRRRAAACRGKLEITSAPGSGSVLTLSIPCR